MRPSESRPSESRPSKNRLPNGELAGYENNVADTLAIMQRVKRLVYLIDEPDALADLTGIAEAAARIRRRTIEEITRRKGEGPAGTGPIKR
ncbi:MAG: hypothetical protein H6662_15730 [Ardenticatenaceae bacterium]|nr:hypothetical protein [Anaerolineales bacterium]MCB8923038.1 hypothetical protein [Ardenticatenaceae bacterium]